MYLTECQQLLDQIIDNRFSDANLQNTLCEKLYQIAEANSDEELMGVALFYQGETLFLDNPDEAESYVSKCLPHLLQGHNLEVLARAYNLLGILAHNKDNLSLALDYYLSCNEICEKNNFSHIQGLCTCNIGVIFQMLDAYEKAIPYFEIAIHNFSKESSTAFSKENTVAVYTNLFVCHYRLKHFDKASEVLAYLHENKAQVDPPFTLDLYDAFMEALKENHGEIHRLMQTGLANALAIDSAIDFLDSYQLLAEFLFEQGYEEELIQLLDHLDKILDKDSFPRVRIELLKYRLSCIKDSASFESYMQYTKEYMRTYALITDNYHHSILDTVDMRFYIEELKIAESRMEKKSRTDALTQIYNRTGFNDLSVPLFEKAIITRQPISIAMVDVDFFKQINDSCGHSYGDRCLYDIASALSKLQSEHVLVCRYGGDEFLIFTYGKTKEEVEQLAAAAKAQVEGLMIAAEGSLISNIVTLSQGIYYKIPTDEDTIFTYVTRADETLYEAKKSGRNTYLILAD